MEVQVIVSDGDVFPVYGKQSDSQMRWLTQPRFSNDQKLEDLSRVGWLRYTNFIPSPWYIHYKVILRKQVTRFLFNHMGLAHKLYKLRYFRKFMTWFLYKWEAA